MQGQQIGDYRITDMLGSGGFGTVWKAEAGDGTIVAVKLLNSEVKEQEKVVHKFFNEAMILAKLNHQFITKLITFLPIEDTYAIVMEYVDGITLKDHLIENNYKIPFNSAMKMARQSLEAFQFAHENGILHRDIKPGNIMLDRNQDIKLMDFGIGKISSTPSHHTASSMLSVHYTSPERFTPDKPVDVRSEIYSLGIVFYEMFAGRKPFVVDSISEMMYCHLHTIPDPPKHFEDNIPTQISNAILKSLEKEPANRFPNFQEFWSALEGIEVSEPNAPEMATSPPSRDGDTKVFGTNEGFVHTATAPHVVEKKRSKFGLGLKLALSLISVAIVFIGFQAWKYLQTETTVKPESPAPINAEATVQYPNMVLIDSGEFTMGSEQYSWEKPIQKIVLDTFWIDKFPVTNREFSQFVEQTNHQTDAEIKGYGMVRVGKRWKQVEGASWQKPDGLSPNSDKENHPVTQISYNDAQAYCRWKNKDLPTEAQWEKAARGPQANIYPWGNQEPDDTRANFNSYIGSTTSVDAYGKGASVYGLYDMAGNVNQWCRDWYAEGQRNPSNPTGPEAGEYRVTKGSSFVEGVDSLRASNRNRYKSDYSSFLFGFRCACPAQESDE